MDMQGKRNRERMFHHVNQIVIKEKENNNGNMMRKQKQGGKVWDVTTEHQQQQPRMKKKKKKPMIRQYDAVPRPSAPHRRPNLKAVDEDLYKIPPELLRCSKMKRMLGFIFKCLVPAACVS